MKPDAAKNVLHTPLSEEDDIFFMKKALKQAERAEKIGEVPIGCVIVYDKKIVGRGYNRRNTAKTALAHAEITAISKACKKLGDWRLEGCTMYVTLEPCQMCSGAIVQSRIDRVVIGAPNPKAGCAGSILNILNHPGFNHQTVITENVCSKDSTDILKRFFKGLRKRLKEQKDENTDQEI